ncbi:phosphatidylinositol N-acetylglucosaminyltransferase subunit P-like isoform X2 [Apium graveolens]|uniref:phosphatidylinositol N-acetylglucosaminyltransferase subunit P-like isoform X2 n=1 Tax=Apium graveolens TaxID=4045 RepID=UPI003D7B0DE2
MENRRSVNSPRRILRLSRDRRATVFFKDTDDHDQLHPQPKSSSSSSSDRDGGPKPSEVYGFVGSITTVVTLVVFLVWAYVPEYWLHTVGIYYYPNRYWAIAAPTYAMVTLVLVIGFYIGINFMVTPPPTSFNTIFDEYSRNPVSSVLLTNEDQPPIPPMFDINISEINDAMFTNPR